MRRRMWAGAVAALAVVSVSTVAPVAAAAAPAPGACPTTPADQAIDAVEYELYTRINDYRVQNGRPPLALHQDLTRAAAWFARDMASKNYFPGDHVDSNGRTIPQRFTWCGIRYNAWRENIAAHTDGTALTIFNMWVNSSTHNTNMLATDVYSMGLARAFDASSQYDYYFVNTFTDSFPLPVADFDDSGTTDVSVFRPSSGQWYVRNGNPEGTSYGANGDIPVPADYNGDGFADKAVFRPSTGTWFIQNAPPIPEVTNYGASTDIPVPADYDGDGDTDIAVFRPSNGTWFIKGAFNVPEATSWGANGDVPVPADYTGDGKDEIAVFRPSTGTWFVRNVITVSYGASGDIPVPADYNGDRAADIAVFRPSNGVWFRRNVTPEAVQFGLAGACCADIPVPGDYDGDGDWEVAVFRKASGHWFVQGGTTVQYGVSTDIPTVLPPALRVRAGLPV